MVLDTLKSLSLWRDKTQNDFCCVGKAPVAAEFIRFEVDTPVKQTFSRWVDTLYQQLLIGLKSTSSSMEPCFPIQGVCQIGSTLQLITILHSQDAQKRVYPFGISRWVNLDASMVFPYTTLTPFQKYFQTLTQVHLSQYQNSEVLYTHLKQIIKTHTLQTTTPIFEFTLKNTYPQFLSHILALHSWTARLHTIPDLKKHIVIPLQHPSFVYFWLPLLNHWLSSLKWKNIYWQKDKMLVSFSPVSAEECAEWILNKESSDTAYVDLKTAADPILHQSLTAFFKQDFYTLLELLKYLGNTYHDTHSKRSR